MEKVQNYMEINYMEIQFPKFYTLAAWKFSRKKVNIFSRKPCMEMFQNFQ
jgi:hypothetical protein